MSNEESVVKSIRVQQELLDRANVVFAEEGLSFSEAIRVFLAKVVDAGRIPRILNDEEISKKADAAKKRTAYIDDALNAVIPHYDDDRPSAADRILNAIFGRSGNSDDVSDEDLLDWGRQYGFSDKLSPAALAELYDCGDYSNDPWFSPYSYETAYDSDEVVELAISHRMEENLKDNLEQVKRTMQIRALSYLLEKKASKGGNYHE